MPAGAFVVGGLGPLRGRTAGQGAWARRAGQRARESSGRASGKAGGRRRGARAARRMASVVPRIVRTTLGRPVVLAEDHVDRERGRGEAEQPGVRRGRTRRTRRGHVVHARAVPPPPARPGPAAVPVSAANVAVQVRPRLVADRVGGDAPAVPVGQRDVGPVRRAAPLRVSCHSRASSAERSAPVDGLVGRRRGGGPDGRDGRSAHRRSRRGEPSSARRRAPGGGAHRTRCPPSLPRAERYCRDRAVPTPARSGRTGPMTRCQLRDNAGMPQPARRGDPARSTARCRRRLWPAWGERPLRRLRARPVLHDPVRLLRLQHLHRTGAGRVGGASTGPRFAEHLAAEVALARAVLGARRRPGARRSSSAGAPRPCWPPAALGDVLRRDRLDEFGLAADAEVTTEANPDSVDPRRRWPSCATAGFNRISLRDAERGAARPGGPRPHAHAGGRAGGGRMRRGEPASSSISLDLIYGTPGETLADWRRRSTRRSSRRASATSRPTR